MSLAEKVSEEHFNLTLTPPTLEEVEQGVKIWAFRIRTLQQMLNQAKDPQFVLRSGLAIMKSGSRDPIEVASLPSLHKYLPQTTDEEYFEKLLRQINIPSKGNGSNNE